jgi:tRNA-specific 2-thiouridylase
MGKADGKGEQKAGGKAAAKAKGDMKGKAKALVLFSGGLDSILTVRLLQERGVHVEAVNVETPFYPEYASVKEAARRLGVKLHTLKADGGYLGLLKGPKHGFGSGMNPCVDCKAYMLRKAESLRRRLGRDFLVTGEVLGERPMSQTRDRLMLIEREAGLRGRIVRPLSGRLLPATEAESRGFVRREWLLDIQGRGRNPQFGLAKKLGVREFPSPAGGCLLTDPEYSRKLRKLLALRDVGWQEAEFLKLGRQFLIGGKWVVVGRHEEENGRLAELAKGNGLGWIDFRKVPGPVAVLVDEKAPFSTVIAAAQLAARYSDAKPGQEAEGELCTAERRQPLSVRPFSPEEADKLRL